jgi:RsiW-degrading membrane proteinase PrsW (M82 family)
LFIIVTKNSKIDKKNNVAVNVDYRELILLVITAFLPPIIFAIWIRNTEKYHKEKWRSIFLCFFWGATIAVVAAIILEYILNFSIIPSIQRQEILPLISVVIIAPFAEELTKPLALRLKTVKKELSELEDGLIYGAVAGLGFSATENFLYGWSFGLELLTEGLFFFLIFMAIRSFGGCLLHASATAWTGYGYGKTIMRHTSILRVLPYFIFAIFIHAFYNFVLSYNLIGATTGLFIALTFTAISIQIVRKLIINLDKKSSNVK